MLLQLPVLNSQLPPAIIIKQEEKKPDPVEYVVKESDTLEKIALDQHRTPQELFNKNLYISDPNVIKTGQIVYIPSENEKLDDRPFPDTIKISSTEGVSTRTGELPLREFSVSGNLYAFGNCTFFAKQQRPDLPNNLGNADTWFNNAAADGLAVGYTPKVGAVAVAVNYTHVAIVVAVHGSTVTVSEMNYVGFNQISSREAPIGEFRYIY